jgi:peroxiredoxin
VSAEVLKGIKVGMIPPSFSLPDDKGAEVSLSSFEGTPLAIIFWSTWSSRSEEILEDFRKYHEEYAAQGLNILAVNIDGENLSLQREEKRRSYIEGKELPYLVLIDKHLQTFVSYGVMAHPSAVLIDRGGKVVYALGGYPLSLREELEDNIRSVLGKSERSLQEEPPAEQEAFIGEDPEGDEKHSPLTEPAVMLVRNALADGDTERANSYIKSADPSASMRNDARYVKGFVMLLEGQEEAMEAFRSLSKSPGGEGWGKWGLGLVLLADGKAQEAVEKMKEAAALQPDNSEAQAFIRRHLVSVWKEGETETAEEELLTLFPELTEVRNTYVRLFRLREERRDKSGGAVLTEAEGGGSPLMDISGTPAQGK